jgi:hypothetical protein
MWTVECSYENGVVSNQTYGAMGESNAKTLADELQVNADAYRLPLNYRAVPVCVS